MLKLEQYRWLGLLPPLWLTGCGSGLLTTVGPDYLPQPFPAALQWQNPQPQVEIVPLPHQGNEDDLLDWWRGFRDPTLLTLLQAAESISDSLATAQSRIMQARASLTTADSVLLPSLDMSTAASKSSFSLGGPAYSRTQYQIGLQSSWEIDLFGGLARQQQAMQSQLASRQAAWHDARVSVAVETANAYLEYRYCRIQEQQLQADVDSRQTSAKLIEIAAQYGFRSPADATLSKASAAEGKKNLLQQQGQCLRSIKGLVALTGLEEAQVLQVLKTAPEQPLTLPAPPAFRLEAIPARALRQRPDLAMAERDMAEASANVGVETAKRYPRLSLSGNITPSLQSMNGSALALAQTWSLGPTLSLPLFDGGKRAADVAAAEERYTASISTYRAKVRTAVKEVEQALVRLTNVEQRLPTAQQASDSYQQYFKASKQLYEVGLGNLLDMEIARRNQLAAELALKEIEQEQVSAWIALYRATGGRWNQPDAAVATVESTTPSVQE